MAVRCAGIILAGGRNTRMEGHPKGRLQIAGKSFLDRIAAAVKPVSLMPPKPGTRRYGRPLSAASLSINTVGGCLPAV